MAKSTCLLALFVVVVVCAEAVRIDTAQQLSEDRQIPGVRKNDPRCKGRTGLFVHPKDCRKFIKCVRGDSKDMKCPRNFKFDSLRHCIPPKNKPDCKDPRTQQGPTNADVKCPRARGMYPIKSDCHKYMVCYDFIPTVRNCSEGNHYSDMNGACIKGDNCPKQYSEVEGEASVCKMANEFLPDEKDCRKYIKCVNFKAQRKECPHGKAFQPRKRTCTREQFEKCKNNDLLNIEPDE